MKTGVTSEKHAPQLILALDVDSFRKAQIVVRMLYPRIRMFKVGSQLFTACGPAIIDFIHRKGAKVFLDLKFHDIPNTVASAVRQATRLKVAMLTIHTSGGEEMLQAAVAARDQEARKLSIKKPLLIGVTVLTSQKTVPQEVVRLAKRAKISGLDGVVCSAKEVRLLRSRIPAPLVIVTPGIRCDGASANDQKRVATVSQAIKAGSDFLVVGRPVLEAKDPASAAQGYLQSLRSAMRQKDR